MTAPRNDLRPALVALTGMVALGVAMGIGRFAFTPLLPLMLADGSTTIAGASWLASANYIGYLVGALLCMVQPWIWQRRPAWPRVRATAMVRLGLAATVLLTLGMAAHWPTGWPTLRFLAGVASALVFVFISGWCLGQLARLGTPEMGAMIYIGPGAGIVISGMVASGVVAVHASAALGWAAFGALAALLTAAVWGKLAPRHELQPSAPRADATPAAASNAAPAAPTGHGAEITWLTLAYGLAGFGYIITATFLPVIARQQLARSVWLDLFWPLFGLGVCAGAYLVSRLREPGDRRLWLAGCYVVQALGVASGLVFVNAAGFALGSLLLGLPFTVITYLAMQEVRRLRPQQVSSVMSLLTATYGLGQIVGPPLAAALVARSPDAAMGFRLSLTIAAAALLLGALLYGAVARLHPIQTTSP